MPALRGEHVHLPRVLPQLDARGGGDGLALVDEVADEIAEVAELLDLGEVGVVRQPGQRGDGVHGRVEDQLRPLRGPQVVERLRLQAGRGDQRGDRARIGGSRAAVRADPGRRVEDVLDRACRRGACRS